MSQPSGSPPHASREQPADPDDRVQARHPKRNQSANLGLLLVTTGGLAAVITVALTAITATDAYLVSGLPDPGSAVRYGLPLVRVIAEAAAVVCIGSLWLATFGVPAGRTGYVTADGYAALRAAGGAAAVWCTGAVLVAPLLAADSSGRPLSALLDPAVLVGLVDAIEQSTSWLLTAGIALVVAIGCRLALSWTTAASMMLFSVAGLLPVIATGHSASGAHDVATSSLLYHLVGASVWIGGLIAVLAHAARGGAHLGLVVGRFSGVALVCWIIMAASGTINAATRVALPDLVTSDYGLLLLVKVGCLAALGIMGSLQRSRAVRAVLSRGRTGDLVRWGAIEVVLMLATIGVAVALGRTPPPAAESGLPSRTEELIGYDLAGPPTVARLLFDWRFDLVYGAVALVLAALYLRAVRQLRSRAEQWSLSRTVSWLCGCAIVLLATSSGIGRYAPAMPSVQMASWLALALVAPALLMWAAPLSLAQRLAHDADRDGQVGPIRWAHLIASTSLLRFLTRPWAAAGLLVGLFAGVYFTGLLETGLYEYWLQPVLKGGFLLSGCLLYSTTLAIDPTPLPARTPTRLLALVAAGGGLAAFGSALLATPTVIGSSYYRGLGLDWMSDIAAEQHLAGASATITAGLPVLMAAAAWARSRRHATR